MTNPTTTEQEDRLSRSLGRTQLAQRQDRRNFVGDFKDGVFPIRTNGGGEDTRDEGGDPCSSCGEELRWDGSERMTYCLNDWYHG